MLSLQGFEDALQHAGWLRCGEYATKSPGGPVSILQLARVGEEGGHAARDLVADGPEAGVIERFRIGEVPIDAVVRRHVGARIATTHGDDVVPHAGRQVVEPLGTLADQADADLAHERNRAFVDFARGT